MLCIFDIGDTLLGGKEVGAVRRLDNLLSLGYPMYDRLRELVYGSVYGGMEDLARTLSHEFNLPYGPALNAVRVVWEAQRDEVYVLDGARQALDSVRTAGHKVAFLSNSWPPFAEVFEDLLGQYYCDVPRYFSHEIGRAKPDSDLLLKVCRENGFEPSQSVMIGDDYRCDIAPAIVAGTKSIWVLGSLQKKANTVAWVISGRLRAPSSAIPSIDLFYVSLLESL